MATIANHTTQMPTALFRNEQPAAGKKYTLQKTALLLITLLVFGLKTSAQKLSGKITDNKANPLELATLQLFSAKDTTKPLQITLSDSTGGFLFKNSPHYYPSIVIHHLSSRLFCSVQCKRKTG